MGSLSPENLCAHRKGAIEELIKGRVREKAAQLQILFGKPPGDHDGPEELLVKLLTSFADSLSRVLMSSCEDCEVTQIPNQVRPLIGDQRSVDPGESSKRPPAKDRSGLCKRRCTDKHDQGCQATKHIQRIQEAPHMNPTNYFGHHTFRSYSLSNPSQNPLLEAHLFSFSSKTISTQDSEPYSGSFSSKTISTQDSEPYSVSFSSKRISTQDSKPYSVSFSSKTISTQDSEPYSGSFSSKTISTQDSEPYSLSFSSETNTSASSVRKECGEETVQTNGLFGDMRNWLVLSLRPQPMIPFSQDERQTNSGGGSITLQAGRNKDYNMTTGVEVSESEATAEESTQLIQELSRVDAENKNLKEMLTCMCENFNSLRVALQFFESSTST